MEVRNVTSIPYNTDIQKGLWHIYGSGSENEKRFDEMLLLSLDGANSRFRRSKVKV